jgi:hypothetical protein
MKANSFGINLISQMELFHKNLILKLPMQILQR